ncbi:MAG: HAD family hydrolase [Acetobacteraceae bacterium]
MPPTLLLDLDGTLVDSVPDLLASANRVLAARNLAPFTAPELAAMVGDGAAALVRKLLAARGLEAQPGDVEAFLVDYTAHPAALSRPYDGVPETLRRLAHHGWRLAVCTNKPEAPARTLLADLGLIDLFASIGGGDSYPTRKPDPAHALATLQAAGGDRTACVMVGDHHNDVVAAAGAGLPCIFAAWGYGTAAMGRDAQATAQCFAEIPALAAALLATAAP